MNSAELVREAWLEATAEYDSIPFFSAIANGNFTANHYAMLLREIYHNTHENPEAFARMTGLLRGDQRKLNKKILRHSWQESGHDQMALDDLARLGYDPGAARDGRALWATEAFTAFTSFQMERRNPLAFLGYVYHLENVATSWGPKLGRCLHSLGIRPEAMSFLMEHSEADITHVKFNEEYFRELVTQEKDLEDVLYGLRGAVRLYSLMLQSVIDAVDQGWPEWRALDGTFRKTAVPTCP